METAKKRPVFLNLFKIRLPIGGVVSIAHRITGIALVLLLPFGIYLLQLSLTDSVGFNRTSSFLSSGVGRLVTLLAFWIFAQHLFSGIRHLLLDMDIGLGKTAARGGAWLTWVASIITVVAATVWIL